jgi:two-component system, NarL family, sensor histidine kinase DesK
VSGIRWSSLRWSSLWYLVFLGYLAVPPLFDPSVAAWAVAVASGTVFAAFWLRAQVRPAPPWSALAVTLLGVAVVPVNGGGTVFFVYAAAFAGSMMPRPVALRWFVGLSVLVAASALISPAPDPYLLFTVLPPLVSVWIAGLACAEERQRGRESAAEQARVEHLSTLAERERIARDLHDLLGHTLTGIVVRAQLAQRLPAPDALAEMAAVEDLARTALTEVRAAVTGWRRVSLDDELAAAVDALAAAGVEPTVTRQPGLDLTPPAEHALALALREAVTNVVRHARATRCAVVLGSADGRVRLEVTDDGVGSGSSEDTEGNGLAGMRERIAVLGGEVRRTSSAGTSVRVTVPASVAAPSAA